MTNDDPSHVNITVGQSSNAEKIGDDARAFQGQASAPVSMRSLSNPRGRPSVARADEGNNAQGDAEQAPTSLPKRHAEVPTPGLGSDTSFMLERKLNELAQEAVTYQVESYRETHGQKTFERQCEPLEAHYGNNNNYNFESGELYRVWHPTNTEVHLGTFLVVGITGNNMTCLRIECCNPEDVDQKFERTHGRLKMQQDVPGSYRRRSSSRLAGKQPQEDEEPKSLVLFIRKQQRLKDNCWVDLLNPWNINWQKEYRFVYCGCLEKESFESVRDDHLELYRGNLKVK
ncbi:MAG: hypothetical protein Q9160_000783 [Pyrenula sp. 1 TL-2023]